MISGVSTASWLLGLALGSSVALKTAAASVFLVMVPATYVASIVAALGVVTFLHLREPSAVFAQASPK